LLLATVTAQTNSPNAQTNNATPSQSEEAKNLEIKFQKFLKNSDFFRPDIKAEVEFKPEKNWYDASVTIPIKKLKGQVAALMLSRKLESR
jgi:hypothetical protein